MPNLSSILDSIGTICNFTNKIPSFRLLILLRNRFISERPRRCLGRSHKGNPGEEPEFFFKFCAIIARLLRDPQKSVILKLGINL